MILCSRNCGHHVELSREAGFRAVKNQLCSDPLAVVGEISSPEVVDCEGDAIRVVHAEWHFSVADGLGSLGESIKLTLRRSQFALAEISARIQIKQNKRNAKNWPQQCPH